ncbi:Origin recognition complex subunit 1 [Carabus blaptoides fortunei]
MVLIQSRKFCWLGEKQVVNDNNGYAFYSRCKLDKNEFEVGGGVTLIYNKKLHIGCVHHFYENPYKTSPIDKFQVVLELFHSPRDLNGLITNPVELDSDCEILKKEKVELKHLPIDCLRAPCLIVYGLEEEEPCDLMQEFAEDTTNAIFVCRYIAAPKNGKYSLRGVVVNQIVISDDETNTSRNEVTKHSNNSKIVSNGSPRAYAVTQVDDSDTSIKISAKRRNTKQSKNNKPSKSQNALTNTENSSLEKQTTNTTPVRNRKYNVTVPQNSSSLKLRFVRTKVSSNSTTDSASDVEILSDTQNINENVIKKDVSPSTLLHNLTLTDNNTEVKSSAYSPSSLIKSMSLYDNVQVETAQTPTVKSSVNMKTDNSQALNKRVNFSDSKENAVAGNVKCAATLFVALERLKPDFSNSLKIKESPGKMDSEIRSRLRISTRRASERQTDESYTPVRKSLRQTPRISYAELDSSSLLRRSSRQRHVKHYDDYIVHQDSSPPSTPVPEDIVKSSRSRAKRTNVVADEPMMTTPKKQLRVVSTPKSSRILVKNMTPGIEERDEVMDTCGTPMQRARAGLSFYKLPAKTPCRESEYMNIYTFISGRLRDQTSGCMYISGVPGTGKTMTVCKVMKDLAEEFEDFVFLKLNALALTEPRQIYVEIVKKLKAKTLHWEQALNEIERFFKSKPKKIAHVLLIDELDKLCNRKQDVIYNLLDLPFHSATPLIVITIANTMDLPERILTNKVNSRLGLVRLTFKPYQYKDLVKIVTERLSTDRVFKSEALELVARKVAAVSGDARRALAICSRATEVAEEEETELITMEIVDRVVNEMISSSKVKAVKCCSRLEQLILSTLSNEVTRTGNEEVPFMNLIDSLEKLCFLERVIMPSVQQCLRLCHHLGSFRLLIIQHGRMDINMTVMLNISPDDIHFALR